MEMNFTLPTFGRLAPATPRPEPAIIDFDLATLNPIRREAAIAAFEKLRPGLVSCNGTMAPFLEKLLGIPVTALTPAEQVAASFRKKQINTGAVGALALFVDNRGDEELRKHGIDYLKAYYSGIEACLQSLQDQAEEVGLEPEAATDRMNQLLEQTKHLQNELATLPDIQSTHDEATTLKRDLETLKAQTDQFHQHVMSFTSHPETWAEALTEFSKLQQLTTELMGLWRELGETPTVGEMYGRFHFKFRESPYTLDEVKTAHETLPGLIKDRIDHLRKLRDKAKALGKQAQSFTLQQELLPLERRKQTLLGGIENLTQAIRHELDDLQKFSLSAHIAGLEERMALPFAVDRPQPVGQLSWTHTQLASTDGISPEVLKFFFHQTHEGERIRLTTLPEVSLFCMDNPVLCWITEKYPADKIHMANLSLIKIRLLHLTLWRMAPEIFTNEDEAIKEANHYYDSFMAWLKAPMSRENILNLFNCRQKLLERMFRSEAVIEHITTHITERARIIGQGDCEWLEAAILAYTRKHHLALTPKYKTHPFVKNLNYFDLLLYFNAVFSDAVFSLNLDMMRRFQGMTGMIPVGVVWQKVMEKAPGLEPPESTLEKARILIEEPGTASSEKWITLWDEAFCIQTPERTYFAIPNEEGGKIRGVVGKYLNDEKRRESQFTDMITCKAIPLLKSGVGYALRDWKDLSSDQTSGLWYGELQEKMKLLGSRPSRILDIAFAIMEKTKQKTPWVWQEFLGIVMKTERDSDKLLKAVAKWIIDREPILLSDASLQPLLIRINRESHAHA